VSNKPPVDLVRLIEAHVTGFNTQNNDLFASVFSDSAVIIDGIRIVSVDEPQCARTLARRWRQVANGSGCHVRKPLL
jgi:hypothetical protein